MIKIIKKYTPEELKAVYRKIRFELNKHGNKKQCYICKNTFNQYLPFSGIRSVVTKAFETIGSDIQNYKCIFCGRNDRERHLFMYFDALKLWDLFYRKKILHFAPEKELHSKIKSINPQEYVGVDINIDKYNDITDIKEMDITNINYHDEYFDVIICNHVLEHIPEYKKGMKELYRVLKNGGFAILQTPYSPMIQHNFEDPFINTDDLRKKLYGQRDHLRIFGMDLFKDLEDVGFKLDIKKHSDLFSIEESIKFGVNPREPLMLVRKP